MVNSGKFNVSVLSRPESTATYDSNVKVFKSDYSEASLVEAFKGQDAVVSALGAGGLGDTTKVIDAAVKAGVKRFLPSEYGSNTLNAKATALIPVFGLKTQIIEHLKKQEAKGLTWTAIEAGPAFDWVCTPHYLYSLPPERGQSRGTSTNTLQGAQMGLVGFNVNTSQALIFDGGSRRFSASNLSQVGNAVVAVLSKPEETANQFIYIDSFTASQNDILAAFEKASGKKWEVSHSTTESAAKEGQELFAKGDFSGLLLLLKANFLGEGYGSDFTKDATLANEKLGLPVQSLESTVATLVAGGLV